MGRLTAIAVLIAVLIIMLSSLADAALTSASANASNSKAFAKVYYSAKTGKYYIFDARIGKYMLINESALLVGNNTGNLTDAAYRNHIRLLTIKMVNASETGKKTNTTQMFPKNTSSVSAETNPEPSSSYLGRQAKGPWITLWAYMKEIFTPFYWKR
jgi:hypothetical protein